MAYVLWLMSQRARLARHAGKLMIHWMAPTHQNGNVSSGHIAALE